MAFSGHLHPSCYLDKDQQCGETHTGATMWTSYLHMNLRSRSLRSRHAEEEARVPTTALPPTAGATEITLLPPSRPHHMPPSSIHSHSSGLLSTMPAVASNQQKPPLLDIWPLSVISGLPQLLALNPIPALCLPFILTSTTLFQRHRS